MSLVPMPLRVVLKRVDAPRDVSNSSPFFAPDSMRDKPVEAIVEAIPAGPSFEYGIEIQCPVTVGQRVLIGKYAGDYDFRGGKVTIVRFDEILAVIEEDDEHVGLPSASDLDEVAGEQDIKAQTKGSAA